MRYIHTVQIKVFLKPEEYASNLKIIDSFKESVRSLADIDYAREKVPLTVEEVEGFENRKIKIITLTISKEAHTNIFIKTLKSMLGLTQCKKIIEQKESRLDDELCFYIRLDKESMLKGNALLTDSGDCIHIKINIAAYPKNREAALNVIEEIFR